MQFSTMNESHLHKTIKLLYAEQYEAQTEVEENGYIYDIKNKNQIIEIQTKNLAKLLPKIMDGLERNENVILVHPIPVETRILLKDEKEEKISNRKSPKKMSIYSVFRELTGIYPILLNPQFTLEILQVKITEERMRTNSPVQSKNRRRRFCKNWIKTGKHLDEIICTQKFNSSKDYISLLPKELPEKFTAKDLSLLLKEKNLVQGAASLNTAHLMIWVLTRMELIEQCGTKNKSRLYKIK